MECEICAHAYRYRGRLVCKLFHCSTPFARSDESQCGEKAEMFTARSLS